MSLFRNRRRVVLLPVWLALLGLATAHAAPPFSLDGLIAQTIRNHPGVAARHAEVKATQAEVDAARSQYYPTPSVQLLQDKGEPTTVLTLQQPLWAGGRLDAGLEAAQSRENSTRISVGDTQYTLALRVTAAWAAWMQARGRGEALDKGIALLNVYVESVGRRIQGGASGQVDRELVAARMALTQGELAAARSAERSALARLAQMIGQPLRSQDLVAMDAANDTPLPGLDVLVTQAFDRSAALKRLEADIETARHETRQRRAALWPTLSLRAQHQRGNASSSGITANDSRVMLVLEYTPGAGLSAAANIDAAEARIVGLRENLDAARRELTDTVTADYEDHLSGVDRRRHLQRTIKASAEVLASYDRLFVAGKRNWLDVINAARELIQAQTSLADVDAQLLSARARLRLHIGETP